MSCARFGSHHWAVFFLFLVNCWTAVAVLFSEAVLVGVCSFALYPWLQCARGLWSQDTSPDWGHQCNKFWGTVPRWWHISNLSWTEFSLGWVFLSGFHTWQVSYPVLVIWIRVDSKLLKTDIFCSQLPMSAAGTNVPELCDWLWLCPAALGVFCLNVVGGKHSAVKCNGNLSQFCGFTVQYDGAGKKKLHSTVLIHEGFISSSEIKSSNIPGI